MIRKLKIKQLMPSTVPHDVQALARAAQRLSTRDFDLYLSVKREIRKRGWLIEGTKKDALAVAYIYRHPDAATWHNDDYVADLSSHQLAALVAADRRGE